MRAIGFTRPGSPDALTDLELPEPTPGPRDLLVEVRAVSVNPVDTKVRASARPQGEARVLGFDAVGRVRAVGAEVEFFAPGDEVFYAGSLDRAGTNAQLHVVDERIVGAKPASLTDAEAAAMPLTSITAWELLFDRLGVPRGGGAGRRLLITGAAGGVGSVLTQLAAKLTGLEVVATASTPASQEWVRELGAHRVIDHRRLAEELDAVGPVDLVASLTATDRNFAALADAVAPQGAIAVIDDPKTLDVVPLKRKSVSLHWELMFTRSLFGTADMAQQRDLLMQVSALVDAGRLKTTLNDNFGTINAENLKRAHALLETGKSRGKIVLAGF